MSKYHNSDVIELTEKDFDNKTLIKNDLKNKNGIIKFYAPWCGYCKNMVEDLKFLAKGLKNKDFFIAAVNTEDSNELSSRFNIIGIPTLYTGQPMHHTARLRPALSLYFPKKFIVYLFLKCEPAPSERMKCSSIDPHPCTAPFSTSQSLIFGTTTWTKALSWCLSSETTTCEMLTTRRLCTKHRLCSDTQPFSSRTATVCPRK